MSKKPQGKAFFELLAEERRKRQEKTPEAEAKPAPIVRRAAEPVTAPPPPAPAPPQPIARPGGPSWKVRLSAGRISLTYFQVGLAVVVALWLCTMSYLLGRWVGGRGRLPLPDVPARPTFEEVRGGAPSPGLVPKGEPRTTGGGPKTAVTPPSGGAPTGRTPTTGGPPATGGAPATAGAPARGAPATGGPPTTGGAPATAGAPAGGTPATAGAPAPAAGAWRVRVARLAITNPEYTDKLRHFLQQGGVETELELRRQYYYLYTHARFATEAEAEAFAQKVNALQRRFAAETKWAVPADAFPVTAD
jgi:hypothetical protein